MIVIPSVEAFAAGRRQRMTSAVQSAATVDKVVAEALDGGAGGGDIDAMLASLPDQAAAEMRRSTRWQARQARACRAWDMGPAGHLSASA